MGRFFTRMVTVGLCCALYSYIKLNQAISDAREAAFGPRNDGPINNDSYEHGLNQVQGTIIAAPAVDQGWANYLITAISRQAKVDIINEMTRQLINLGSIDGAYNAFGETCPPGEFPNTAANDEILQHILNSRQETIARRAAENALERANPYNFSPENNRALVRATLERFNLTESQTQNLERQILIRNRIPSSSVDIDILPAGQGLFAAVSAGVIIGLILNLAFDDETCAHNLYVNEPLDRIAAGCWLIETLRFGAIRNNRL